MSNPVCVVIRLLGVWSLINRYFVNSLLFCILALLCVAHVRLCVWVFYSITFPLPFVWIYLVLACLLLDLPHCWWQLPTNTSRSNRNISRKIITHNVHFKRHFERIAFCSQFSARIIAISNCKIRFSQINTEIPRSPRLFVK